jgi:hypothetical protein
MEDHNSDLSPKKLHSKEEWEQIDAERRKAEDEAWLKRKAKGEVTTQFVVRNKYGVHPDEESLIQMRIKLYTQSLPPSGKSTGSCANEVRCPLSRHGTW